MIGVKTQKIVLDDQGSYLGMEKRGFKIILSYIPSTEEETEEESQEKFNRRIVAWRKDKGFKKMTPKRLKDFEEDYMKIYELLQRVPK